METAKVESGKLAIQTPDKSIADIGKFAISVPKELTEKKDALIAKAKLITEITTDEGEAAAVLLVGEIKGMAKTVEKDRVAVKEPVLQLGAAIDSAANEFKTPLGEAAKTIESLIGARQFKIRKQREEEERKQKAEQERVEREAKKAADEAAKKAEEARLAAESASSEKAEEAELAEMEAQIEANRLQKLAEAAPAPVVKLNKPMVSGASVKPTYDIEIKDVKALYAAFPHCVKLEASLSSIRNLIAAGTLEIPGVQLTETTKVAVRATASIKRLQ